MTDSSIIFEYVNNSKGYKGTLAVSVLSVIFAGYSLYKTSTVSIFLIILAGLALFISIISLGRSFYLVINGHMKPVWVRITDEYISSKDPGEGIRDLFGLTKAKKMNRSDIDQVSFGVYSQYVTLTNKEGFNMYLDLTFLKSEEYEKVKSILESYLQK